MGCFLNIVKNDAGMSGRNWQIFDLNIIAHFLAKGFLTKVPILKNTALEKLMLRLGSLNLGLNLGSLSKL